MGLAQLAPLLILGAMAIMASLYVWDISRIIADRKIESRASEIGGLVMQQETALVVEYAFIDGETLRVFVSNPGDIDLAVTAVWVPHSQIVFSSNAQTVHVGEGVWLDPLRYSSMQGAKSSDLVEVLALPLPLYDGSDPSQNSQYQVIAYWPSSIKTGEP